MNAIRVALEVPPPELSADISDPRNLLTGRSFTEEWISAS